MITLLTIGSNPIYSIQISNPELGDNLILDTRVTWLKAADGTTYGYKKTPSLKKHNLVLKALTRRKALELMLFLQNASRFNVQYIDKDSNTWQGILSNNEFVMETSGPGRGPVTERQEENNIVLQFVGQLVYLNTLTFEDWTTVFDENSNSLALAV